MDIQEILKQVLTGTAHNPKNYPLKNEDEIIKYFMGGCYGCSYMDGFITSFSSGVIDYKNYKTGETKRYKIAEVRKQIISVYKSIYFPQNTNVPVTQLELF